jgi:hypothetical protein
MAEARQLSDGGQRWHERQQLGFSPSTHSGTHRRGRRGGGGCHCRARPQRREAGSGGAVGDNIQGKQGRRRNGALGSQQLPQEAIELFGEIMYGKSASPYREARHGEEEMVGEGRVCGIEVGEVGGHGVMCSITVSACVSWMVQLGEEANLEPRDSSGETVREHGGDRRPAGEQSYQREDRRQRGEQPEGQGMANGI